MTDATAEATAEDAEGARAETHDSGTEGRRERSAVPFAYTPLSDVVDTANAVIRRGHSCSVDELAADLNQQMTSGAFRGKLGSARLFGVIDTSRGMVTLTDLGLRLTGTDRQAQTQALVEAFFNVPLYRQVYDQFAGHNLPPDQGIEAAMRRLGVPEKQTAKARQVLFRSAETAGFFNAGRNRLVRPVTVNSHPDTEETSSLRTTEVAAPSEPESMAQHPLIKGLVAKLPPEGERFSPQQRRRWLEAARINLELIYASDDEESSYVTHSPEQEAG